MCIRDRTIPSPTNVGLSSFYCKRVRKERTDWKVLNMKSGDGQQDPGIQEFEKTCTLYFVKWKQCCLFTSLTRLTSRQWLVLFVDAQIQLINNDKGESVDISTTIRRGGTKRVQMFPRARAEPRATPSKRSTHANDQSHATELKLVLQTTLHLSLIHI